MKATILTEEGKKVVINLTPDQIKVVEKSKMNIMELIKTFDDACEHQGINIDEFNKSCVGLTPDEIAYRKLKIIIRALNENVEADWNNPNEIKYYPVFDMRSSSGFGFSYSCYVHWLTPTYAGSRLSLRSEELSDYVGKQFQPLYKDFFTIN